MAITDLPRRVYWTPTGDLSDPDLAMHVLSDLVPETGNPGPHLAILDLRGKLLSPASLRELIVPLGQGIRGGAYGDLKLVVAASDPAILEQIGLLAREHSLPIYLSSSQEPHDVEEATPVGDLTPAELETLNQLRQLGGMATVSRLAEMMNLEATATTNRVVNVEKKGYVHRIRRGRQQGDLFVDPRTRRQAVAGAEIDPGIPGMREALLDEGIRSNPYEPPKALLRGDAAKRAQEIIRRGSGKV
jgi:MarR family